MTTETLTVTGKPKPLDLLLFRRFKREIPGFVEATYALNPGLAALGPVLPLGTTVLVTLPGPPPAVALRKLIRLFE